MKRHIIMLLSLFELSFQQFRFQHSDLQLTAIDIVDLSYSTDLATMLEYYKALHSNLKVCIPCGVPAMGTTMHLELGSVEFGTTMGSMTPDAIPSEYLLSQLVVLHVSEALGKAKDLVLTKEMALRWEVMHQKFQQPTMLLFHFGWTPDRGGKSSCACKVPGLSYELAEYIAQNLTHVVAVATDTPSVESDQTRELTDRTVSNVLAKQSIYILENVYVRSRVPEQGCLAMAMPLKLQNVNIVPTRLTAFCPKTKSDTQVVIGLKSSSESPMLFATKDFHDLLVDILKE